MRLTLLREAEREALRAYRLEWQTKHSIPYRTAVAEEIQRLLDKGMPRKVLLEAMGTKNYATLNDYLGLIAEPEEAIPEIVLEDVQIEVGEETATVDGHEYVRTTEGDWEPKDFGSADAWKMLDFLPKGEE